MSTSRFANGAFLLRRPNKTAEKDFRSRVFGNYIPFLLSPLNDSRRSLRRYQCGLLGCLLLWNTATATETVTRENSRLVEQHALVEGAATQGLALAEDAYYGATEKSICRFDTDWNFLQEKSIRVEGVNHLGAIDYHDGYLWGGFLNHGLTDGKYDRRLNRAIIAKIRAKDLEIIKTWDITADVKWIDPVCFDGRYLWVGDMSDLGIHRYKLVHGELIRDGIFRYPQAMSFSQGIRIVGNKLYTIHTFGTMDGLFEFDIPEHLSDTINCPKRVWKIQETKSHLEGFDFIPGQPRQIWHAQGKQVDRYELETVPPPP